MREATRLSVASHGLPESHETSKSSKRTLFLAGAAVLLLGAGMLTPAFAQQGSTFGAELVISRSGSVIVLQYHRDIGMIAEPDPVPFLRIYGDGRYVVHYPHYMKKAGDWEGRISSSELSALLRSAAEGGLLELDAPALESQMRAAEQATRKTALATGQSAALFEVSDKESTRVRVWLDAYKPAGIIGAAGKPLDKEIIWWGLRQDAKRHPQFEVLQKLAALEASLRALAEAPGLQPVGAREEAS